MALHKVRQAPPTFYYILQVYAAVYNTTTYMFDQVLAGHEVHLKQPKKVLRCLQVVLIKHLIELLTVCLLTQN